MSLGQFEDAPEDHTSDPAVQADSFVALNGANTATPLPGTGTGSGNGARPSGVGYIDDVDESVSSASAPAEHMVSFQRLDLQSQAPNDPTQSDDEEELPLDPSGEDEDDYDVEIDDEDWEVADSGESDSIYIHLPLSKASITSVQTSPNNTTA